MSSISRVSLDDTLQLIQLVRETALAKGRSAQANRLGPVVDEMRGLAKMAQAAPAVKPAQVAPAAPMPAPAAGILGQSDFKRLLEATKTVQPAKVEAAAAAGGAAQASSVSAVASVLERNRLMSAMSAANMSDVEIAKQFGVSRDEVRLVLNVQNKARSGNEVIQ